MAILSKLRLQKSACLIGRVAAAVRGSWERLGLGAAMVRREQRILEPLPAELRHFRLPELVGLETRREQALDLMASMLCGMYQRSGTLR